jgi:hypothetical protein
VNDVQWIEGSMRFQYDDHYERPTGKTIQGLYFAKNGVTYMKTIQHPGENWTNLLKYMANEDHAILVEAMLQQRDELTYSQEIHHNHHVFEGNEKKDVTEDVSKPGLSWCEFGIVGQLEDLSDRVSALELQLAEEEWTNPIGLGSKRLSHYNITGLAFSQNCNVTWRVEGYGLRQEYVQRKALNYSLMMITVQ